MARLEVEIQLRWGDQDEYGHINNVSYARYLEESRVRVFSVGETIEPTGLETLFAGAGDVQHKMLVSSQQIEFLRILHYTPRPARIELWIGRVGGSSLEVHSEIIDGSANERVVVARAITYLVLVDGETLRPKRVSDEERVTLARWSDEPLKLRRS